jgi:hypothetical protein
MTTKLTLTIEEKVVSSAKKYARKRGKSLSGLVENYLKSVSRKEQDQATLSPKVSRLKGVIKLPENYNYKKEIGNELAKKYKK